MGSSKDAISKRRPRQNIIFQILKNAKRQGSAGSTASATNTSTASSSRSHAGAEYHGSKRGILASAVELTRRSKRITSRGGRDGGGRARIKPTRRKRNQPFVKGQKAFYRSAKGIAKVTVVGIHHDAKLEPYYTIQLRDGKEKQTDGKHLTPIQEEVKEEKKKEQEMEASSGRSRSKGARNSAEILTDPMSDSDGGVKEVVIDYTDKDGDEGMRDSGHAPSGDALVPYYSSSSEEDDDDQNAKKFALGQDAYYRSPGGGGILKIRVRARGDRPNRYNISLPNNSIAENVRASKLATLMDLTSKELSTLMKERNKRQRGGGGGGGHGHGHSSGDKSRASSRGRRSRSRPRRPSTGKSSSAALEEIPAAVVDDVGYDAGEGEPTSSGSEPSLSSPGVGGTGASSSDPAADGETKEKPPLLALPAPIRMVEAFTESGEKKTVPLYGAGMHVRYQNAAGIMPAEILSNHLDDLLDPYYTIRLADGREKQTDNAHILVNEPADEEAKKRDEAEAEAEAEAEEDEEEDEMAKEERKEEEERVKEEPGEGGGQGQEQEQVIAQGKDNHPQEEEETMPHRQGRRSSIAIAHQTPKHPVAEKWLSSSMTYGDSLEPFNKGILESSAVKKHQDPDFSAAANTPAHPHPAAGRAAASPTPAASTPPAKFAPGDDVLYSSSAGDCMKAVVVRVQRDKKSRHFFLIKLREGKEKQVYGHRLKLLADVEGGGGRRARSRSRGLRAPSSNSRAPSHASTARSRGRSQASKGATYHRSESIDSRASDVLSNSSRRSEASRGRAQRTGSVGSAASRGRSTGRHGDESLASTRGGSTIRSRRDESLGASVRSRASHGEESTKRASRDRSQSTVRRTKSIANSGVGGERKHRREGRERSLSRAPSEDSRASSSHHHSSSSNAARSRASRPAALSVSMSSKSTKEEDHSTATGGDDRSTTKSISRLRNFRKSFAMRKH